MKETKFYFAAILISIFTFSCQQESIELSNDENLNLKQSIQTIKLQNQTGKSEKENIYRGPGPINNSTGFETTMQWVSYITAKVIYDDEIARNEFLTSVSNNETIALDNILGTNESSQFKTKFLENLYSFTYFSQGNNAINYCPGSERIPPIPPLGGDTCTTCGSPISGGLRGDLDPVQDAVDDFMTYVLNENCIELYFPNPLLIYSQSSFRITSTAHPLTNALENDAFLRYPDSNNDCGNTVEAITMSPSNVIHSSFNTIVARPYRDSSLNGNCSYSDYNSIDFTDFLRI